MKLTAPLTALILVIAVPLTACKTLSVPHSDISQNGNPANPTADNDRARRITTGELRTMLEQGASFILDVRSEAEYNEGHIKGAHLLPKRELQVRFNELPKDKLIVTYCACPFDHLSIEAALDIKRRGFENVAALQGGLNAWLKEGLPIEAVQNASN